MSSVDSSDHYIDVYNRKRYTETNRAILHTYQRTDSPFMGGDGKLIVELTKTWHYQIPGLPGPRSGTDSSGRPLPTNYFITTPNMHYIPDTLDDRPAVMVRRDGRYAEADFTLCPQWYFEGTYYLPYIRKKPSDISESHPYRLIWYDITPHDFLLDQSSSVRHLGRLRKPLVDGFIAIRKELTKKINELEISGRFSRAEIGELIYAKEGMLFASVILNCTSQTYNLTLLTVTGFQRHFLEALACYEYLTIYRDLPYHESEDPLMANNDLMGCLTSHLDLAERFYRKGIPVWLVRVPADLPADINIHISTILSRPTMETTPMAHAQPIYSGHASAVRNRACQSLRLGNITLGHSAYRPYAGDFNAQYVPDLQVVQPYAAPFDHSFRNTSSSAAAGSLLNPSSSTAAVPLNPSSSTAAVPLKLSSSAAVAPLNSSSSTPATPLLPASPPALLPPPPLRPVTNPFDVNLSKFMPVLSVNSPVANNVWVSALQSVNKDPSRIWDHAQLRTLRGYAFPDPHVLIKGGLESRGKIYFLSWLSIRSAWLLHSSSSSIREYPSAQGWKDYLYFTIGRALGLVTQVPGLPSVNQASSKRLRKSFDDFFAIKASDIDATAPIQWQNEILSQGGDVTNTRLFRQNLLLEVVWDLFEHNFNFELLALDRAIHPREYMTTHNALHRDALVVACLPNDSFVMVDTPTEQFGLGAPSIANRWEYVEALRVVMSTWSGSTAGRLRTMGLTGPDPAACEALEAVAFPFYCQNFFDYFGRAATIPHQMPR